MTIGKRIKWLRNRQKWTQNTLAEKLMLTLDMVKSMETNRANPSVETVINMSILFKVSSDFILGIGTYIDYWTEEFKGDKPNE